MLSYYCFASLVPWKQNLQQTSETLALFTSYSESALSNSYVTSNTWTCR